MTDGSGSRLRAVTDGGSDTDEEEWIVAEHESPDDREADDEGDTTDGTRSGDENDAG